MATIQTIDVTTLHQRMAQTPDLCLIDVRTPAEFETVHAAGATSIPLADLKPGLFADRSDTIYVICKAGSRSRQAAELLLKAGRPQVISVEGGTDAWVKAGLPVEQGQRKVIPLDRQIQITAGLMIILGAAIGTWVNPWGYALCAFVGVGLTFAGISGFCAMAVLMAKMPWNKASRCAYGTCSTKK